MDKKKRKVVKDAVGGCGKGGCGKGGPGKKFKHLGANPVSALRFDSATQERKAKELMKPV